MSAPETRPPTHPLLVELFRALPERDTEWPIEIRARWLLTACAAFNLLYGGSGEIEITWTSPEDAR